MGEGQVFRVKCMGDGQVLHPIQGIYVKVWCLGCEVWVLGPGQLSPQ